MQSTIHEQTTFSLAFSLKQVVGNLPVGLCVSQGDHIFENIVSETPTSCQSNLLGTWNLEINRTTLHCAGTHVQTTLAGRGFDSGGSHPSLCHVVTATTLGVGVLSLARTSCKVCLVCNSCDS
jgi:hypothetical protein